MQGIQDFLRSDTAALPRMRPDTEFLNYMMSITNKYIEGIDNLNPKCHLCRRILERRDEISLLSRHISGAIRHYLSGQPSQAYSDMAQILDKATNTIESLYSIPISNDAVRPLYRMVKNGLKAVDKSWLFHCPFNLRHNVGQHRYGIPGFPCLYLGGSIQVCQSESRVSDLDLKGVAIGRFEVRSPIKILNFAYRPSFFAAAAGGSALRAEGENPDLEQLIIDYSICWPLIASASLQTLHDGRPFVYEYIIPQLILQWIMRSSDCDGIRYFSTRMVPDDSSMWATTNYVFPAKIPGNKRHFSQPLINKFSLTDVHRWTSLGNGKSISEEIQYNQKVIDEMAASPLI
jgi:hypothetical protein